jgi:hypothetical protein
MNEAVTKLPQAQPLERPLDLPSFETLNRMARAMTARLTQGVSPHAQFAAWFDWFSLLARAPGSQLELALQAYVFAARLAALATGHGDGAGLPFQPEPNDRRFADPAWQKMPYLFWQQAFLAQEEWWRNATHQVRGERRRSADRVAFMARQMLDGISPSNVPWLNPVIIGQTLKEGGANLVRGANNFIEDLYRLLTMNPDGSGKDFRVGENIAITPGEVIFRNELIELIQYKPATRDGYGRAGADRAGLDHEVLRARPFARALAGALPRIARLHRIHGLVAQSDRRRSRHNLRRLPHQGRDGGTRRRQQSGARPQGACDRLLPGRHAARHRRSHHGA